MRTSSPLDDPAAGMPYMIFQTLLENRAPLICRRVWHSSTSTSQVSNMMKNENIFDGDINSSGWQHMASTLLVLS